jgi:transcriptional regulator with XRE-family HTH domain
MRNTMQEGNAELTEVGAAIRALRLRKRLTLRAVAEEAKLSESFLSQLERARVNASIGSLQRVAAALGVPLAELFGATSTEQVRVIRREERPGMIYGFLGRKYLLTPTPLENLEVFIGEFEPGGSTGDEPYAHGDSDELFVVLSGTFELQVGEALMQLRTGDCVNYRSSALHRAVNTGEGSGEAMWIVSPPSN